MKPSEHKRLLFNLALLEKIEKRLQLERKRLFPNPTPLQKFRKKFWRLISLRDAKHLAEIHAPNMLTEEMSEENARSWPERFFSQLPKRVRKKYGF